MRVRVIVAHVSSYPDPIGFEAGERVRVGRRDTEYRGWIRVTTADGNEGWAPEEILDLGADGKAIAKRAYTARELDTKVGETVTVLSETHGWCWVETDVGDRGWVPKETLV